MDNKEKLLYEQYFKVLGSTFENEEERLDFVLKVILNSKEFTNTRLQNNETPLYSKLLELTIKPVNDSKLVTYFSGSYYVSNGEYSENRSMNGTVTIKNGNIYLIMNIDRLCIKEGIKQVELAVMYEPDKENGIYNVFSSYNVVNYNESDIITFKNFDLALENFKELTIKELKDPSIRR